MLIELFSLGVTAEALRAIIGSKSAISLQRVSVDPKFRVEGVAPANHSSSQKTRLNGLSYGIKNLNISFLRFVTMHAFDRRTDRRTDGQGQTDTILIARLRLHSMQRGKNLKTLLKTYKPIFSKNLGFYRAAWNATRS